MGVGTVVLPVVDWEAELDSSSIEDAPDAVVVEAALFTLLLLQRENNIRIGLITGRTCHTQPLERTIICHS